MDSRDLPANPDLSPTVRCGHSPKGAPPNDAETTEALSEGELIEVLSRPPPADTFSPGEALGAYVIEQRIGEGGGGVVYAARDSGNGRRVALKLLRADMVRFPSMLARFIREATAVGQIRHPNIVEVYEVGTLGDGRPYYAMELLEGMDLRKYLKAHGRCTAAEALALLDPICRAVHAAHEKGFIHRDIKANNVFIAEKQGQRVVKLLDFGIAKLMYGEPSGQGLTEPGTMLGTPYTMAPEQVRCERLDARADVYAIGVLSFQMLTGQYPFQADDARQIAMMQLQTPAPRPSSLVQVSPALDAVILRCLEKNREKRFGSAADLLVALRDAVGESDRGSEPGTSSVPALGAYFEVLGAQEELDDDAIEDISNVLDTIEHELANRGFGFPLRTTSALLAVCLVDGGSASGVVGQSSAALINDLYAQIERRAGKQPGVRLNVSVTVGEAVCRGSASGELEVVGGPLLEVDTWMEHHRLEAR